MKSLFRITLVLFLFAFSFVNKAQAQIPPDTTTYWYKNESGVELSTQRPKDSLMLPGKVLIRFRQGALDYSKLLNPYLVYYNGSIQKNGKNKTPQTGPLPNTGSRGFPNDLRYQLLMEKFFFDSTNNIVKSSQLKSALISMYGYSLERLTTASPIDTLSITRTGDTIGCDHHNWMILNISYSANPLLVSYVLTSLFSSEVIFAQPVYSTAKNLRRPGDDRRNYDTCQVSFRNMIGAEIAWQYEVGDSNVLVAHYDEGIDYRHPDLGGGAGPGSHVLYATQFAKPSPGNPFAPVFQNAGHGTPCMGLIGALTNRNDHSVAGLAGGWGTLTTGSDAIERGNGVSLAALADDQFHPVVYVSAIFEASAKSPNSVYGYGANAINTSAAMTVYPDLAIHAAVNYAYENNVVQTMSINQDSNDEAIPRPYSYPANFEEPWILSVGGSMPAKELIPYSNWGYTMDLLAPSGNPLDGCGQGWSMNHTTQSNSHPDTPIFFYQGFGGTSASAPQVAGSAGLLLSHFRKKGENFLGLEPEDYAGILKASAWKGQQDRINSDSINYWRNHSGWGHLDIGKAFQMLDPDRAAQVYSGYEIRHYNYSDSLNFGAWTTTDSFDQNFDIPWNGLVVGKGPQDTTFFKYKQRSYLLNYDGGRNIYKVRVRPVTRTVWLDSIWEVSGDAPLFSWGRKGNLNEKNGWSYASQNFQTGWSKVVSGTGGNENNEGIFHSHGTKFSIETAQYEVWSYDKATSGYTKYLGLCPPDSMLGVCFSVYGRVQSIHSGTQKDRSILSTSLQARYLETSKTLNVKFDGFLTGKPYTIELFNIIGKLVSVPKVGITSAGINEVSIHVDSEPTGIYICRVSIQGAVQSVKFKVIR